MDRDVRRRLAGTGLGAGSGVLLAVGAQLPWERLQGYPVVTPGCFGCGTWTIDISGRHIENGALVFIAGLALTMAALLPVAFPAARRLCAAALAAALVVAASAAGGWWLKHPPYAVASAGMIELSGIIVGLAAVTFFLPGPARRHGLVLTGLSCVLGVAVAWTMSAPIAISS